MTAFAEWSTSCFGRDVCIYNIFISTFVSTFYDTARLWFDTLSCDSYSSWVSFLGIFYMTFPTPDMRQIMSFTQHDGEPFHQV